MKNLFLVYIIFCCMVLSSCQKQDDHYPGESFNNPSTTYAHAPAIPIDTNKIWGVMLAVKSGEADPKTGIPPEQIWAWFYNDTHTAYLKMDSMTFNGRNCDEVYYYPDNVRKIVYPRFLYHTENVSYQENENFRLDSNIAWVALNDTAGISIIYNYTSIFPEFSGVIPSSASIGDGLNITLDSSTVRGADSVQVTVGESYATIKAQKTFGPGQGSVNISLGSLKSTGTVYTTVTINSYSYVIQTLNNKDYVFIKQEVLHKNIYITQ